MKDKYLCKDGITEKYNFREQIIDYGQRCIMLGGFGLSALSIMYDFWAGDKLDMSDFKQVVGGFGVGVVSLVLGNYLHRKNEEKKEKALKSVEARLLAEGRK